MVNKERNIVWLCIGKFGIEMKQLLTLKKVKNAELVSLSFFAKMKKKRVK